MKFFAVLLFLLVQNSFAQTGTDSLARRPPEYLKNWQVDQSAKLQLLQPRMESDGLVIGNTKYFMKMYRPDSSVDYKILRVTPNMRGLERMPGSFLSPPDIRRQQR